MIMSSTFNFASLRGIIPPMVTPLSEQNKLDVKGLSRLIEHILSGKVHGLFILGTTGEGPSLSYELRRELIKRTCEEVDGHVPILVGISDTSFSESVSMACYAAKTGASAVVLAPPYYYPIGQLDILDYLNHITQLIPLPVFLYNMPSCTKISLDPETVQKVSNVPGIVGIKDSSANMLYFHKLKQIFETKKEFSLLMGTEELLAEALLMGAHGGVPGGANIFPRLYVDLYNAAIRNDIENLLTLQQKIIYISSTLYSVSHSEASFIKVVKCILSCKGICTDLMAEPLHPFGNNERSKIKAYLEKLDIV